MGNVDISYIISIGIYPYFAQANIRNVAETCGYDLGEIDFVFVTYDGECGLTPRLQEEFDKLSKLYPFRVITCPFDAGWDNTRMYDWVFQNDPNLREWVLVQHCDVFWTDKGWLRKMRETVEDDTVVVRKPDASRHRLGPNMTPIPFLSEIANLWNRDYIRDRGLVFKYGYIETDKLPISETLRDLIARGEIYEITRKVEDAREIESGSSNPIVEGWEYQPLVSNSFMDGGQLLSLEVAVDKSAGVVLAPVLEDKILHLWGFFRIAMRVFWDSNLKKLFLRYRNCKGGYLYRDLDLDVVEYWGKYRLYIYSFVSSLCMGKDECPERIFPISLMRQFMTDEDLRGVREHYGKYLEQFIYYTDPDVEKFGGGPSDIEAIEFEDCIIEVRDGMVQKPDL